MNGFQEPSVVVTLGIGLDVKAETTLKNTLPFGSRFFAADPIFKGNGELYEPVGLYFPFAVGKETDVSTALVLKNGERGYCSNCSYSQSNEINKLRE